MPGISDAELRRRLEAHKYPCPPITEFTKSILVKKLHQLDQDSKTKKSKAKLFEYSSAEEDTSSTPSLRRRKNISSQRKTVAQPAPKASHSNGKSSASKVTSIALRPTNGRHKSTLVQLSDEEEEDNDEDDDDDQEDEEVEDDESNKTSSDDDDDGEEEEDGRANVGQQTSFSFDSPLERSVTNGSNGRSPRFTNSTPITPKSTASYLNGPPCNTKPPMLFPPNSPLRRAVAKNKEAFGSLGEALASLSTNSLQSNETSSPSPVSQVQPTKYNEVSLENSRGGLLKTKFPKLEFISVSKIIMIFAALFFAGLAFKYLNLKPRIDLESKLNICKSEFDHESCIQDDQLPVALKLFDEVCAILEAHSANIKCHTNQTDIGLPYNLIVDELKENNIDFDSNSIEKVSLPLLKAIEENPQWGIALTRDQHEVILSYPQPELNWMCWLALQFDLIIIWSKLFALFFVSLTIIFGLGYSCYRLYLHRMESKLREQQDVFELVEQVLSLLMKHHHHYSMHENGGAGPNRLISRASVPVNHIRDQLIPPQERHRKRHIWHKVVKYIHDSESRVREDVRILYGEEHKVWQWIPEVSWNPMSHPGPNPYVAPLHVIASSPSTTTPTTSTNHHPQSPLLKSPMMTATHTPTSTSSKWQGSAFNSLNHNVAAPSIAPSCCLKVRHLFDKAIKAKGAHWVRLVSDEILNRCSVASICHIAVDTESNEGCVYIKAKSTDDAAKVFKTLHGQWYRGNLVTAKYLRDERYVEKFPDSRNHFSPMRPGTQMYIP